MGVSAPSTGTNAAIMTKVTLQIDIHFGALQENGWSDLAVLCIVKGENLYLTFYSPILSKLL